MKKKKIIFLTIIISLFSLSCVQNIITVYGNNTIYNFIYSDSYSIDLGKLEDKENKEIIDFIIKEARKNKVNMYEVYYDNPVNPAIYASLNTKQEENFRTLRIDKKFNNKDIIGKNDKVEVKTLQKFMGDVGNIEDEFYIKGKTKDVIHFVNIISKKFNLKLPISYSEKDNYSSVIKLLLFVIIELFIIIIIFIYLIIEIYFKSKKVSQLYILGYSKTRIFWDINKNNINLFLISFLLSNIIFLIITGSQFKFLLYVVNFIILSIILIISMFFSYLYIKFKKIDIQSLYEGDLKRNGYKFLKGNFLTVSFFLICILSFISPYIFTNLTVIKTNISFQEDLKDYTSSSLISIPNYDNDKEAYGAFLKVNKLYKYWEKRGLIVHALTDQTETNDSNDKNFEKNEIYANVDYINSRKIKDINGNILHIDKNQEKMIELVPKYYQKESKKIQKYIDEDHRFLNYEVGLEKSKKKFIKINQNKVIQIYIEDNPDLLFIGQESQRIKNPIIRVITYKNTSEISVYADQLLGRDGTFIKKDEKYKLGNNYDIDPYRYLDELSNGVDTNTYLKKQTMSENDFDTMAINLYGIIFTLHLIITFFIMQIYMRLYQRKLYLNYIMGYRKIYILKNIILLITSPWLFEILYSIYIKNFYLFILSLFSLIIYFGIVYIMFNRKIKKGFKI